MVVHMFSIGFDLILIDFNVMFIGFNQILISFLCDFQCGLLYDFECWLLYHFEYGRLYDYECRSHMTTNVAVIWPRMSQLCDNERAAKFSNVPFFSGCHDFPEFPGTPNFSNVPFCLVFRFSRESSVPPSISLFFLEYHVFAAFRARLFIFSHSWWLMYWSFPFILVQPVIG